jgi:hypothetical protein
MRARTVDPRLGINLRRAVARAAGVVKKRHAKRFYRYGCRIYSNNLACGTQNPLAVAGAGNAYFYVNSFYRCVVAQ